jgi:hypothetical protein
MACIRNMHSLIGSRTFTLPMHEQRFMFFSAKDVKKWGSGRLDKVSKNQTMAET